METHPVSVITMRASSVVSIAFAKTGCVSLCTIFSEMFPPGLQDVKGLRLAANTCTPRSPYSMHVASFEQKYNS